MDNKNPYVKPQSAEENKSEFYMPDSDFVLGQIDTKDLYRVTAGRVGACAAVVVFICCYIYGIVTYGFMLGIGVGWLFSAVLAWLTAFVVASALPGILRWMIEGTSMHDHKHAN
jgi:hypothetical protein